MANAVIVAAAAAEAADRAMDASDVQAENLGKTEAMVEHDAGGEHLVPEAFGLPPVTWVAMAMTVFIIILLWKKVPAALGAGLDKQINAIKGQLDEAKALRAEAEKLRAEYAAKIANAEKDAAAMLDHARSEADAIIAKAETDSNAMIARREKMASDKIGAAERAAVDDLRAKAADAATMAARNLIASGHNAAADKAVVDQAINALN